jgi:hypothetical protein
VRQRGIGHEDRRIPGPPGDRQQRDRPAGHAFHHANDGAYGGGAAGAEIERERGAFGIEMGKRLDMRRGEIGDVNEVPLACAVGGRIVGPEDLQRRALARRRVDGERDQVRLRVMPFGEVPSGSAPAALKYRSIATRNGAAARASPRICSPKSFERS